MGVVQYLHDKAEQEYTLMDLHAKDDAEYAIHRAVAGAYEDAFRAVNKALRELDASFNKQINEMSDFRI